jgi:hypothetical protein
MLSFLSFTAPVSRFDDDDDDDEDEEEDENTINEDKIKHPKKTAKPKKMVIPVDPRVRQVTVYVDRCQDRGGEDDVDVIRLQWEGDRMLVWSHRMEPGWDEACASHAYGEAGGLRWVAGAPGVRKGESKEIRIGQSLEVAFWKLSLPTHKSLEFTGVSRPPSR